jgi:hypothetical protein
LNLRILRSAEGDGSTSTKPFRLVSESTLQGNYAVWWYRLLLFLLRVACAVDADTTRSYISIPAVQLKQVQELDRLLQHASTASTDGPQLALGAAGEEEVLAAVKTLSQSLIFDNHVTRSPFQSPLIAFVGCVGYQTETGTWRRADETTPLLSGLIYIMRLITLHSVLPAVDIAQIKDPVMLLRSKVKTYLQDGTSTPFTELFSLRAYGKMIARHFYARPSVVWSNDMSELTYKGKSLRITNLAAMMRQLITDAESLLCEQLVFQDRGYLQTRQPCGYKDDWTWRGIGDSMVDVVLPHNLQSEQWCPITRSALLSNSGSYLFVEKGGSFEFCASGQLRAHDMSRFLGDWI